MDNRNTTIAHWLREIWPSLRYAARQLRRNPGFTLAAVLTLGIGVGANTAIFSLVNGVLLRPLPYPNEEGLIAVVLSAPRIGNDEMLSAPFLYFTYRDEHQTFEDVGLWRVQTASVTGLAEPEQIRALQATSEILPILGVEPLLGRMFSLEDDARGSPLTTILAYGYWQGRLGGDPAVIGQRLVVDGEAREVIGVMPQAFRFLDRQIDLIYPYQLDRNRAWLGGFSAESMARLKPGVTLEQASADVSRMIPIAIAATSPSPGTTREQFADRLGLQPNLRSLKHDVVGDTGNALWVLMGTMSIVLLIACTNVATLLLVRAEGLQQEMAVRAALGAGWGRLARDLILECLLLGLLGGVAGLAFAYGGVQVILRMAPANLPRLADINIDPMVLSFTLVISLFSGLVFGLIAVLEYSGPRRATVLRVNQRSTGPRRERHRARNALVVVQVALALVLLVCAGLMIRTFQALRNVDPGFRPEEVQTLRISIPETAVPEPERAIRMLGDITQQLAAIPGVTSVAIADSAPMESIGRVRDVLHVKGQTYSDEQLPPLRRFGFVSPGFFQTVGTPIVAGRDFSWADNYERRFVAIVSEKLAREEWETPADALGQRIRSSADEPWREVIGVAGDVHDDGLSQPPRATAYFPVLMDGFWNAPTFAWRSATLVIRSSRVGTVSFLSEVRQAVWAVNANLPLASVRTLSDICNRSLARISFTLVVLAIAGAMALLLGIVGVHGVVSYGVCQRRREIGIRLALGARQSQLKQMFVRQGLVLGGTGVVIGLGVAMTLTRLMSSLLFEISPLDAITYATVPVILLGAAILASYLPARSVTAMDPIEALRAE